MKSTIKLIVSLFICSHVLADDLSVVYQSASNTPLSNPHDVKLSPDGKYLFVSDVGNNRVVLLDPETLLFVGAFGDDHQSEPVRHASVLPQPVDRPVRSSV